VSAFRRTSHGPPHAGVGDFDDGGTGAGDWGLGTATVFTTHNREPPGAWHRVQSVLDHVGQRPRKERPVNRHRGQAGIGLHVDGDPIREPGAVRLDDLLDQRGQRRRLGPRRGRRCKARELGRDLAQQLHLRQDRRDAVVQNGRQRAPAIDVHALRVLGRQLDRRQRVLDLVGDLTRHVGPRFEPLRAFELRALTLEVLGHLVEVLDQAAKLVRRSRCDAGVQVASGDPPRGAGEPVHRIGDPLRMAR